MKDKIKDVGWSDSDDYKWKDYTVNKKGKIVKKRVGPTLLKQTLGHILKFFTCFVIVAGWVLIAFLLGIDKKILPYFLIIGAYLHIILSKFVFSWP